MLAALLAGAHLTRPTKTTCALVLDSQQRCIFTTMEREELLKIKPNKEDWTWADLMPETEAVFKRIGAQTYVKPEVKQGGWRELTPEELAAYNEKKRLHEEEMQAWEAKRREELAAEGDSVEQIMARVKHLQPGGAAAR